MGPERVTGSEEQSQEEQSPSDPLAALLGQFSQEDVERAMAILDNMQVEGASEAASDSIELSRNAKGEASWSIKKYYRPSEGWEVTLTEILSIDQALKGKR